MRVNTQGSPLRSPFAMLYCFSELLAFIWEIRKGKDSRKYRFDNLGQVLPIKPQHILDTTFQEYFQHKLQGLSCTTPVHFHGTEQEMDCVCFSHHTHTHTQTNNTGMCLSYMGSGVSQKWATRRNAYAAGDEMGWFIILVHWL